MEAMTPEQKIMQAMRQMEDEELETEECPDDEDDEETEFTFGPPRSKLRNSNRRKNKEIIESFIGSGPRSDMSLTMPGYYFTLYAWAVGRHIQRDGWEIVRVLAYDSPSPLYFGIRTSDQNEEEEQILVDGHMLVGKEGTHLVVSIYRHQPFMEPTVHIDGPAGQKEQVEAFAQAVKAIATAENFYRGKNLDFSRGLRIIDAGKRSWESVILPPDIKGDIRANTLGFLQARDKWGQFGMPLKRGVLLAGEPGTGKTAICKAIMKEAGEGVTCITSNAYALDDEYYISTLYEIARDLSPAIVFIEDIDMIGEDREDFQRMHRSALVSLLAELDGIEEQKEVVTVATTNSLEALDKALSCRPSRFDRVITLELPSLEERQELVRRLCVSIPLSESVQGYIARSSHGCTPAQVEEIIRSLVIERVCAAPEQDMESFDFSIGDVDRAIRRINGRHRNGIGFKANNVSNGKEPHPNFILNEN